MRYVSNYQRTALYSNEGKLKYQWENGVLVVGDPALDTAGNQIDTTQSVPVLPTELQVINAGGVDDFEKVGGNTVFWKAPPINPGTALSLSADTAYEVIGGTIAYKGQGYIQGERFLVDGTVTAFTSSDGGQVALAVPSPYNEIEHDQFRDEAFWLAHVGNPGNFALSTNDPVVWSFQQDGGFPPQSPGLIQK